MEFTTPPPTTDTGQVKPPTILEQFLEERSTELLNILHYYIIRAGLGQGATVRELASELLNKVALEALSHPNRYDPERPLMAWLLGIGANLIKREQAARQRQKQREPLLHQLYSETNGLPDEMALFDWLCQKANNGPEQEWEEQEAARELLQLVAPADQKIIRLAVLVGMNGEELAERLGIQPGAARVRLHRALQRLSRAWHAQNKAGEEL